MKNKQISRRRVLGLALFTSGVGVGWLVANNRIAGLIRLLPFVPAETVSQPAIVPREEWNALPPNHDAPNENGLASGPADSAWYVYEQPLEDVYKTIAIHHTGSLMFVNETMRDVQRLHLEHNGWADVGYHYGIDNKGVIYEGRDIHVRGAAVAGHNTGTLSIVVMGNFEIDQPTDTQLAALQTLISWLTSIYRITHLAAHGEFNAESKCPGANLAVLLDDLADQAGLQRGTGGYVAPI